MQSWMALLSADSESDGEHNDWQSKNIEEHQEVLAFIVYSFHHDLCRYSSYRWTLKQACRSL